MLLSEAIKAMTKLYVMYGDGSLKVSSLNELGRLDVEHIGKPITVGKNNDCFLVVTKSNMITEYD